MRIYIDSGWFGLRIGRLYIVLKDTRRHRAYWSERHKIQCRHVTFGHWRILARTDLV